MAWHLQLGFDERIMQKVDPEDVQRQKYIFSVLTIMLVVVGLMVSFSAIVYMLIIFHSWLYACLAGLFLGLIVFNIYRFLIITSVNAGQSGLASYLTNHEKAYEEYMDNRINFAGLPEEKIAHLVNVKKEDLRQLFQYDRGTHNSKGNQFWSMLVRVAFIAVFAIIFATGIELFLFKDQLNNTIGAVKAQLALDTPDSFLLKYMFTPQDGEDFIGFHCNSLLILLEILMSSLGYWKLVFDLLIMGIFFIPLVLVFKSREILQGDYVRELALHEISISHYHYLKSQKYCAYILQQIQNENRKIVQQQKS